MRNGKKFVILRPNLNSIPYYLFYTKLIITMTVLLLLMGLGLLILGSDWLVDGASGIARKAGISEFIIGLTIVGFGTSCPELVVSLTGALDGNADIAVGNVVGSNIFNILFILGVTSLIVPLRMTGDNIFKDMPFTLAVTLLLVIFGWTSDMLSRWEGIVMLVVFGLYVCYCFCCGSHEESKVHGAKKGSDNLPAEVKKEAGWLKCIMMSIVGLACVIGGGDLFVSSATLFARDMGVSDRFIAVTILASGTSLPELATSITAAIKGKHQLALGNILGSNVFNILLILGVSSVVQPMSFRGIMLEDIMALVLSVVMLLLWGFGSKQYKITRWEGAVMLLFYACYIGCLCWQL